MGWYRCDVSTALTNLKTELNTRATALSDTLEKLKALAALETWYGAAVGYEEWTTRGTMSYSISGRSFQFPSQEAARQSAQVALGELESYIGEGGGNVRFADLSGGQRP